MLIDEKCRVTVKTARQTTDKHTNIIAKDKTKRKKNQIKNTGKEEELSEKNFHIRIW